MTATQMPDRACPQCGGGLVRIRRLREDRDASLAAPVRRFRCASAQCGWEGLLEVSRPHAAIGASARARASTRTRTKKSSPEGSTGSRRIRVGVALSAAFGFAVAATAAIGLYQRSMPNPALAQLKFNPTVPFGTSDDGRPIAANHPLLLKVSAPAAHAQGVDAAPDAAPAPSSPRALELRQDCAWGDPGRNPYKGTIEQALKGARLPPEIVARMSERIRAGKVTDRLEITNTGIRGVHTPLEFSAHSIGMTFGNTLCMNTRVNFVPGHMERADLYQVADASGETYSVMVPYVCGNVSVLSERAEREGPFATTVDGRPLARKTSDLLAAIIPGGSGNRTVKGNAGGGTTTAEGQVPEPGTLLNIGAGATLMVWFMRRRRTGRSRPADGAASDHPDAGNEEQQP